MALLEGYFLANLLPLYHLLKSMCPSNAKPLWEEGKSHHAANDTRIGEISNEEDKWPFLLLLRLHSFGAGPSSCALKGSPVSLLQAGRFWSPLL